MRHTGRGVKHIVVLSRFQFFTFKTLRARSTLEEWGYKACIASLSLSSSFSLSLLPTLSPVRVFPSHKGSQQPFFLIRQRRHRIFPTTLSTRVNNNARKKHAREHCYLATPSFLLSLFFFFFFLQYHQGCSTLRTLRRYPAPSTLLSPLPLFPRNLISSRSTF